MKNTKLEKCTSAFLNFLSGTLSPWGKVECHGGRVNYLSCKLGVIIGISAQGQGADSQMAELGFINRLPHSGSELDVTAEISAHEPFLL